MARRPSITRDDVARLAGVSPRTVSNVVNGFPHITPETRAKVQTAIEQLGYYVNASARSLRTGNSGLIGLVVPELDQPYFAELARGIISEARKAGYTVIIQQTEGDLEVERELLREGPRRKQYDGLIVSASALSADDLLQWDQNQLPLVLLGERRVDAGIDHVGYDNVSAARQATQHLIASGRVRIAAIGHEGQGARDTSQQRTVGFRAALKDAGLRLPRGFLREVSAFSRVNGYNQMQKLLDANPRPDAVFCYNDVLAMGAYRACQSRGIVIPTDIAIVGFDDVEQAAYLTPSLTTIRPDRAEIARVAVALLIDRINGSTEPAVNVMVDWELIVRESSR